jgi:hypothetical protein
LPGLGDQVAELRQIRLRREVVGLVGSAQEAEQAVQLKDGLPAGGFDRAQGGFGLVGLAPQHPSCRPGLKAHDADMVGDDIVELAGDAYPFLEHGPAGVCLPLPLQLDRLRGQLALAFAQRANRDAEQQREGEEEDGGIHQLKALVEGQPPQGGSAQQDINAARGESYGNPPGIKRDLGVGLMVMRPIGRRGAGTSRPDAASAGLARPLDAPAE